MKKTLLILCFLSSFACYAQQPKKPFTPKRYQTTQLAIDSSTIVIYNNKIYHVEDPVIRAALKDKNLKVKGIITDLDSKTTIKKIMMISTKK